MKIAIDVMGGDYSPAANIDGAFDYINNNSDIYFYLVGDKHVISDYLKKNNLKSDCIIIIDAPESITDDDRPSRVFKTKPNSSLVQSINLLKNKEVNAVISAGNTGALLATSLFLIGKINHIKRPALAPYVPSNKKGFILCDAGANVDTKPEHLLQFAIMSKCYLENVENIDNPRIGLLNIGKESNKGNELVKQAYPILTEKLDNFIGNIEPQYILNEDVDIVICDGFTGNITLKLTEGIFKNIFQWATASSGDNSLIKSISNKFDYEEHGGTPILGIKDIVIKCHGSSTKQSIFNSINTAKIFYNKKMINKIEQDLTNQLLLSS